MAGLVSQSISKWLILSTSYRVLCSHYTKVSKEESRRPERSREGDTPCHQISLQFCIYWSGTSSASSDNFCLTPLPTTAV
ncbi:hypothetical protein GDO86_005548 [Hymenochirus boettgeri]|uniref:Uncharacterized protein n=1 Tax=Hymenochirus boettgeri TaxID=247094 RepID=A0A8T2J6W8_9PIPI|nr:hypothetical protein GDO86_005548 [Hymenochirus boettgeri]